jgi:prepilin-type N-terminal cleavage/methylation domain-containing protein
MNKKTFQRQQGFTLLEIVVVMALIALLSTYMMGSSFLTTKRRARDAQRKQGLIQVVKALEAYMNDHGEYPPATGNLVNGAPWGQALTDGTTTYMTVLPKDPNPGMKYVYAVSMGQQAYQLLAKLETNDDPDVDRDGNGTPDNYTQSYSNCVASGTAIPCNYGIASSNTTMGVDVTSLNP